MGGYLSSPSTGNIMLPYLAHLDSLGNMLWLHTYQPNNGIISSYVRNIYPTANGTLFLQTDSLFFSVDTAGTPVTWGQTVPSTSLPEIKNAGNGDFLLLGMLYQDSAFNFVPTVMRFRETDSSGCWRPRSMAESVDYGNNAQYTLCQPQTQNVVAGTINYLDTLFVLDYRLRDGCLPNPLGIDDHLVSQENLQIFPNPANDAVSLQISENLQQKIAAAVIYDQTGRLVEREAWNGSATLRLSTANWADGLYIVAVLLNDGSMLRAKLCVQR
jgi:hypothetical protein